MPIPFRSEFETADGVFDYFRTAKQSLQSTRSELLGNIGIHGTVPSGWTQFTGFSREELENAFIGFDLELSREVALAMLASIEAAVRKDAWDRSKRSSRPGRHLTNPFFKRHFRRKKLKDTSLEEILTIWKDCFPAVNHKIGIINSIFNFRHWLAHGRYWPYTKTPHFDPETIRDLAGEAFASMPGFSQWP